jgi:hypothetical protein
MDTFFPLSWNSLIVRILLTLNAKFRLISSTFVGVPNMLRLFMMVTLHDTVMNLFILLFYLNLYDFEPIDLLDQYLQWHDLVWITVVEYVLEAKR